MFHAGPVIEKPGCKLCGKCCHVLIDGKIHKCPRLIKLKNGKMICRNYHTRLGTVIYPGKFACGMRSNGMYDYPGCPFNTDKAIAPEWRNDDGNI